jgi:hypothetical protein
VTLRDRIPSDPEIVPYPQFRDAMDEVRVRAMSAVESAYYLRHSWLDEPYKLHRTLIPSELVARAERLATELAQAMEEIDRLSVPVVWAPGE